MNKEKLAQLLAEALEQNVTIRLHFHQYHENSTPVSKEEAYQLITAYSEALGTSYIEHHECGQCADDFVIDNNDFRVVCSYIPSTDEKVNAKRKRIEQLKKELAYLEEDVVLDGMGGEESAV